MYSVYTFANDNALVFLQTKLSQNTQLKYLLGYNRILLYSFTIIEYLFFSSFFYFILEKKGFRKIIIALFTLFCVYFILSKAPKQFDSIQTSIEGTLIIIYSIFYFYEQMNKEEATFIYQNFTFWLVVGILIYLVGNLFLFTYAATLPNAVRDKYWIINYVCNITKNVLFAYAIYSQARQYFEKPIVADPFKINLIYYFSDLCTYYKLWLAPVAFR